METRLSRYGPVVVGAVLAFGFALALWQLERDHLALEYDVSESGQFPRGGVIGRYFIVSLQNSGNKPISQIALSIDFDADVVESMQFSEPSLVSGVSQRASEISANVPLLNPDESISVTITTADRTVPRKPTVTARAAGVTAGLKSTGGAHQLAPVGYALFGLMAFAVLVTLFGYYRASKTSVSISQLANLGDVSERIEKSEGKLAESVESLTSSWRETLQKELAAQERSLEEHKAREEKGEPERHQLLFTLMNEAGLTLEFMQSAEANDDGPSYWGSGLILLRAFLKDEQGRDRLVLAMQKLVQQKKISPSSKGFNLYLLGKMEQFRGNNPAAVKWFGQCRDETPLMFQHLMDHDLSFDLAALERALREP